MKYASTFLCHSSKNKALVEAVAVELARRGVISWLDKNDLQVGCTMSRAIAMAIERQATVSVFLSQAAIDSGWVNDELVEAIQKAEDSSNKDLILPVYLGDPLDLVSAHPLLKTRWLHADGSRVDKHGIKRSGNPDEPPSIAKGLARSIYTILRTSTSAQIVLCLDQRGDGPRYGELPGIPTNINDLDAPALVFRPDLADRGRSEVRADGEWERLRDAMRWGFQQAVGTARGNTRKIYVLGDAQLALPFCLGRHFDRSTNTLYCHHSGNGSIYTNQTWDKNNPLQGGNPNCESQIELDDGSTWPAPLPAGRLEDISLLLMKESLLQGAKNSIDRHPGAPPPVWVKHGDFPVNHHGSQAVKAYIADVTALLQRLRVSGKVHLYCTLPVNAIPLLAAHLLHVVQKAVFMEYDRASVGYVSLEV